MLNKINELVSVVNWLICNVRNIQVYVGTKDSTDRSTITNRLNELERIIKQDTWAGPVSEWRGSTNEWQSTQENTTTIKEW